MSLPVASAPDASPRWLGELELGFVRRQQGTVTATVLARRRHRGPLQVQRAFYPEGPGACHVYVLHPPGGLVAGDEMLVRAEVGAGAHALLTTPAASKVYRRGDGPVARQQQRLAVAAGARLEWLPAETIVFDEAAVELSTRVDLEAGAGFIGWEVLCLGRPAAGARFARGHCRQRFELWRAGQPLVIERTRIEGGGPVQTGAFGLQGAPVTGTMLAALAGATASERDQLLEGVRALLGALNAGDRAAATMVEGALIVRYLGTSAAAAQSVFVAAWELLRPALLGRPPCRPRIWLT
jgi:urease accessory protein